MQAKGGFWEDIAQKMLFFPSNFHNVRYKFLFKPRGVTVL